jgi:small subunit ribosomal protein S17
MKRHRATRVGRVLKDKMRKTVVVAVSQTYRHGRVGKYVQKTKKYYVHDEKNVCRMGDKVLIMETRPLSRLKRWRLVKVLERGADSDFSAEAAS